MPPFLIPDSNRIFDKHFRESRPVHLKHAGLRLYLTNQILRDFSQGLANFQYRRRQAMSTRRPSMSVPALFNIF